MFSTLIQAAHELGQHETILEKSRNNEPEGHDFAPVLDGNSLSMIGCDSILSSGAHPDSFIRCTMLQEVSVRRLAGVCIHAHTYQAGISPCEPSPTGNMTRRTAHQSESIHRRDTLLGSRRTSACSLTRCLRVCRNSVLFSILTPATSLIQHSLRSMKSDARIRRMCGRPDPTDNRK